MKGIDIRFSNQNSYITGNNWKNMAELDRITLIQGMVDNLNNNVIIQSAKEDGQVLLVINNEISASARGGVLLDMEKYLKKELDKGITIWHQTIQDKSSLRKLRGIEVLS